MNAQLVVPQHGAQDTSTDSDHDGLSDQLEEALMAKFKPVFMVSRPDCSGVPAESAPENRSRVVQTEDGTIYGQVFPGNSKGGTEPIVEIHCYHPLEERLRTSGPRAGYRARFRFDTGRVAPNRAQPNGRAIYWYAAAHEDTVCDASQISRASTIDAEDHGTTVWISAGNTHLS